METKQSQPERGNNGTAVVNYRKFNNELKGIPSYVADQFERPAPTDNEKTGSQTLAKPTLVDGVIFPTEPRLDTFVYRRILRDPTIALARCLMVAPMTLVPITLEVEKGAPKGAEELVQKYILDRKDVWLKLALESCIDFGWVAFENVYKYDSDCGEVALVKQKQLLHEITWLRANPYTGDFGGIMQDNIITGQRVYLPASKVQLFNIDQRGSNWYGNSMLDNTLLACDRWADIESLAVGYMKKIAGAHWVVKYPVGVTKYNGIERDNSEIARELLDSMEANGAISIPQDLDAFRYSQDNGQLNQWAIENITDNGATSASYTDALKYYDTLKVRALMLPERMILEGEFGTKAEAVAHSEAAVAGMEMRYRGIVRDMDAQTKRQLLDLNYGEKYKDCVRLVAAEITRDDKDFMKQIYSALLNNADVGHVVASGVDTEQLQQLLAIPRNERQEETLDALKESMSGFNQSDEIDNEEGEIEDGINDSEEE